jgi:hypothetical protein
MSQNRAAVQFYGAPERIRTSDPRFVVLCSREADYGTTPTLGIAHGSRPVIQSKPADESRRNHFVSAIEYRTNSYCLRRSQWEQAMPMLNCRPRLLRTRPPSARPFIGYSSDTERWVEQSEELLPLRRALVRSSGLGVHAFARRGRRAGLRWRAQRRAARAIAVATAAARHRRYVVPPRAPSPHRPRRRRQRAVARRAGERRLDQSDYRHHGSSA